MTSGSICVFELSEIDQLIRLDHSWLTHQDRCFFLGEYAARKGFAFSPMNRMILNFKKSVDRKRFPDWKHKERAIQEIGEMFWRAAGHRLARATLVPTPPSKAKGDALHDDRMMRLLKAIPSSVPLDIREIVVQVDTVTAAHDAGVRPAPNDLLENYRLVERFLEPHPQRLIVFDDVLTTGAHYVAMRNILSRRFPDAEVMGFFVARRIP